MERRKCSSHRRICFPKVPQIECAETVSEAYVFPHSTLHETPHLRLLRCENFGKNTYDQEASNSLEMASPVCTKH